MTFWRTKTSAVTLFVAFVTSAVPSLGAAAALDAPQSSPCNESYCVSAEQNLDLAVAPAQPKGLAYQTANFALDAIKDQRSIWTSPREIDRTELRWLVPLVFGTAAVMAVDRPISRAFRTAHTGQKVASVLGTIGDPSSLFGATGAVWLFGRMTDHPRAAETAVFATQALVAASAVVRVLKIAAGRQRPLDSEGRTYFWKGGRSFPSGHTLNIWALAEVVASRHRDRPWLRWGIYALATSISLSRVIGSHHFPSDVVAGGSVGFLIGRFVARGKPRH